MLVFGITGGVGAGKSQVMQYLETAHGARVLLMDNLGHDLMAKGAVCYDPILQLFGPEVLLENGEFNRKAIGAKVFADRELLEKLNAIVHPAVKKEVIRRVAAAREEGVKCFFMESALLLEEKYDAMCDELWYIYTKEEVRRERLKASRGYSDEKIDQMLNNQASEELYRSHCSFEINNSGNFAETQAQIDARMQKYETM